MRIMLKGILLLAAVIFDLLASYIPSNSGNMFEDVWGIATDPLKLRAASTELSSSVERTLIQLNALEGQANYDVQARLEQIRSIVKEANTDTNNAFDRMTVLEKEVDEQAFALIARAECASENVNGRLQVAFSDLIKHLIEADPKIVVAGIKAVELVANPVVIEDPNKYYKGAKAAAFAALNNKIIFTDKSEASEIFWTYQNLKEVAKWARCRYEGVGTTPFTKEMNELERLSLPWTTVVNMKPF
jgi:hypothetical protein